jgi:hypothetical protein
VECLVSYPGSSEKSRRLVGAIRHQLESLIRVRETLSAFVGGNDEPVSIVAMHSNIAFNFVNSSWMQACTTVEAQD